MARYVMLVSLSGTRNGVDWPPRGGVVDLPESEGAKYVRGGIARRVGVESATSPASETAALDTVPRKRSTSRASLTKGG